MRPAVAGEGPVQEPLGVVGVGDVDDRHDAAHAAEALADVVGLAVLGPAAHVARAGGHRDARRELRVGAVAVQVVDGEIRPVALGEPEQPARLVHLDVLVRVEPRRRVGEVRGRHGMGGIRDVDHDDAGVRLHRVVFRRHVGAVIEVRRPVLGKRALSPELADELEIAVVAVRRVAAAALVRRRLALQSGLGLVATAATRLGHRAHRSELEGGARAPGARRAGREGRMADGKSQHADSRKRQSSGQLLLVHDLDSLHGVERSKSVSQIRALRKIEHALTAPRSPARDRSTAGARGARRACAGRGRRSRRARAAGVGIRCHRGVLRAGSSRASTSAKASKRFHFGIGGV